MTTLLSRMDAVLSVLGLVLVLVYLEWTLRRRFAAHEKVEMRQYADIAMTAETAAGTVKEVVRQLRVMRESSERAGATLETMGEEVRMHARRLGAVEERLMRAALVPAAKRPEE